MTPLHLCCLQGHFQICLSNEHCPLFQRGLPLFQRLMYCSGVWAYVVGAITTPMFIAIPLVTPLMCQPAVHSPDMQQAHSLVKPAHSHCRLCAWGPSENLDSLTAVHLQQVPAVGVMAERMRAGLCFEHQRIVHSVQA